MGGIRPAGNDGTQPTGATIGSVEEKTRAIKEWILRNRTKTSGLHPGCGQEKEASCERDHIISRREDKEYLPKDIIDQSPFYPFTSCPNLMIFFRSHAVFWKMADQVASHPRVKRTREVRLMYPASGSHLAPLDLFHNLIKKHKIDRAEAIFTEINGASLQEIRRLLGKLVKLKLYSDLRESQKKLFGGGSETTFSFLYNRKEIKLIFALNTSGQKYYKNEYARRTDVWVIHDHGPLQEEGSVQLLTAFLKSMVDEKEITNAPIIVMENINELGYKPFRRHFLPGDWQEIKYPYGHREKSPCDNNLVELSSARFSSALVFSPQINIWKQMTLSEVQAVADLSTVSTDKMVGENRHNLFSSLYPVIRKTRMVDSAYADLLEGETEVPYRK